MSRQQPDREKSSLAAWRHGPPIEIHDTWPQRFTNAVADRDGLHMGQNPGKDNEFEKIVETTFLDVLLSENFGHMVL